MPVTVTLKVTTAPGATTTLAGWVANCGCLGAASTLSLAGLLNTAAPTPLATATVYMKPFWADAVGGVT